MTDHTDLLARMLTCAARITEVETATANDNEMRSVLPVAVTKDACSLLIEAAAEIEKLKPVEPAEQLGEPMELIGPVVPLLGHPGGQWYDPMSTMMANPYTIEKTCPACGSKGPHTVWVRTRQLSCTTCGHVWRMTMVRQ